MTVFTRQFEAFLAIARLGNFTRAAGELHISQSTLTVQIRNLEDTLGVRLFDRNRRQVSLTAIGRELVGPLEAIVQQTESLIASTRDISAMRRGVVTIAVLPSVASGVLPPMVASFLAANPGIRIRIRDVVTQDVIDLVKAGEVDFGIGSVARQDREIVVERLWVDSLWAFVNRAHPLAGKPYLRLTELSKVSLIITARNSSVRRLFDEAADRAGQLFRPAFETHYIATAMALAGEGLGVAVLPQPAIGSVHDGRLTAMPIRRPTIERRILLIRKVGRALPSAAAVFIDELRSAGRRLG